MLQLQLTQVYLRLIDVVMLLLNEKFWCAITVSVNYTVSSMLAEEGYSRQFQLVYSKHTPEELHASLKAYIMKWMVQVPDCSHPSSRSCQTEGLSPSAAPGKVLPEVSRPEIMMQAARSMARQTSA